MDFLKTTNFGGGIRLFWSIFFSRQHFRIKFFVKISKTWANRKKKTVFSIDKTFFVYYN